MILYVRAGFLRSTLNRFFSSFRGSHQLWLLERSEADVGLNVADHFVTGEFKTGGEDERRLVEAELGGEGAVVGPGAAGGDGWRGQRAPGGSALVPGAATADDAL